MTREEKARSLGQECFPDECNIWARPNYEAQFVSEACMKMAEWERERLVERACEWLELHINDDKYYSCIGEETIVPYLIDDFKKAMEE